MIKWRFPSNDYGEVKGINDTGVAMFRGTPLKSLAREICQNSLDAGIKFPVRIEFNLFRIKSDNIPGKDVLSDAFDRCLEYWKDLKAITTKEHFVNAKEIINSDECNILRISDFNTCGLTGSRSSKNTNWTNLTKSSGSSDKNGTAGGSFGIGKFAPFACSDCSTLFYSTLDSECKEAYQGVSRLVTFVRDGDNETTQGIGYYGNKENTPIYSQLELDPNFKRKIDDYGTDIYVIGYKYFKKGWEKDLLIPILDGFLGAIWNERLEVKIGDIIIDKSSLNKLIETYYDELTGYTAHYYDVLISEKTDWYEEDLLELGIVKLGLLIGNRELPKRVAMIRKTGMKIKDKSHLPGHVPFAGIMFIEGDEINKRLRLIENPEHTTWQVSRSKNPHVARALIKELDNVIIKRLEEIIKQGSSDQMDAVGVGTFLPDDVDDSEEKTKGKGLNDKIFSVEKRMVSRKAFNKLDSSKTSKIKNESGEANENQGYGDLGWFHKDEKQTKNNNVPSSNVTPTSIGNESKGSKKELTLSKFSPVCVDKNNGIYAVTFVPVSNVENGCIELFLSAESQNYKAPLKSARVISGGNCYINDNKIMGLKFKANESIKLKIGIDYNDYCSMEVLAYAIKK